MCKRFVFTLHTVITDHLQNWKKAKNASSRIMIGESAETQPNVSKNAWKDKMKNGSLPY